ncbi:MAG TPA: Ig-like domain-containing protein, partial [Kofleriaceae bacterium]|nr:Ig-like domain-containing protein [Kofleriaceae bacterium]
MRPVVIGLAAASLAAAAVACSDGAAHHVPPDTALDDRPAAITNQRHVRITFHPAGIANRFVCQLDGGGQGACVPPFEADVGDGAHQFQVSAALNAAIDDTPASVIWRVDTVPPDTAIVAGPPPLDNARNPEFAFQGTDDQGAVSFECSLDDAAFAACGSPASVAVADGSHGYRVRAIDAAGNADPTPANAAWVVDSTAPDTAFTTGPAAGSISAADVTFEFGSPDSPISFECSLDGAAFASCTSPRSFTLGDGGHTFAARARDAAGLVDPTPATRAWTVDATPPVVAVSPVASPTNDSTPSVAFTVTGASLISCRIDTGGFAACSSPFTPAALANGNHTITVRGRDAAGNAATAATTFTIDTVAPPLVFDDAPPVQWPVDYYDMKFHTTDATAAVTCSLNGAAFAPCTSPLTISTSYNMNSTFSVQAVDPAGNVATISTAWTSADGLVLHYPWEQGATHNTSLLAQRAGYGPDGSSSVPVTGGWAGTAAASPGKHGYPGTIRALSSSANGTYTASIWVRIRSDAPGGTILSTLTGDNGFALSFANRVVTLQVNEGSKPFTTSSALPIGQWVQLGLLTTGSSKGLQLLVNGTAVGTAAPPKMTGFGPGQATDLIVGTVTGIDLDDLRFYNRALSGNELCTTLVRGQLNAAGACVPLIPGFELDFETSQVHDTGTWGLGFTAPQQASFVTTKFGTGLQLPTGDQAFGFTSGFTGRVSQAPGRSFTLWFVAAGVADTLIDFLHPCNPT